MSTNETGRTDGKEGGDIRQTIRALEPRLRRYLPTQLLTPLVSPSADLRTLRSHPGAASLRSCNAHLAALLRGASPAATR